MFAFIGCSIQVNYNSPILNTCTLFIACVNIYNDPYCEMQLGNCWRQATARDLVKNCRKTCVCKCCPATPVTLPTTATLSNTTTATSVSSTRRITTATTLYSSTTEEIVTSTPTPQTSHSFFGTEGTFEGFLYAI